MHFKNINNEEFLELYKNKDYILLDIRSIEEFNYISIKGALFVDFYSMDFEEVIDNFDKNKKYLLYCRSGKRSFYTMELMKEYGFKEVYNLKSGINQFRFNEYLLCSRENCEILLPY